MTARALRVGILLGGNLVEERLFADGTPITIGQSLRCRLSVPADGVPHEHALFVRDQGRLLLCLAPQMTGRVAQGDAIQTNVTGTVAIERGARGKLQIGDATILFQEVAAPARTPRPQLPASVRGTFADRVDRRLAVIVGGSLLVHLAIGAWAWATDVEQSSIFESKPIAEYHQDTYAIDVTEPTPAPTQEPGAATPVAPVQTPAPIVKPTRITTPSAPPQMTNGDAQRFAQILTGNEAQDGGRNEISNRLPGTELDKQINDIRDNNRKIGNDEGGFRTRAREGIGDGRNQIVENAPSNLEQQQRHTENLPPGRIDLRPKPRPPGDGPSPERIIGKIRTDYMPGLKRCYQQGLRTDPSLAGKVAVTFTVTDTGKVSDAGAKGVTPEVDACIATQMASWRFPAPKDKDGDPVDLDISLSLALAPGN